MKKPTLLLLLAVGLSASLRAEVKLPSLFSDNMVLQSGGAVPMWGKAAAGEKITVQVAGQVFKATADEKGAWRLALDTSKRPDATFDMIVTGDASKAPLTIRNVLVGEVWLAAGQSNMWKPVGPTAGMQPNDNWEAVVAQSDNPQVRVFTVGMRPAEKPADDCGGKWELASPQTTAHFTAAGYFFARELNKELHVPVGIIHSSWGGTRAESWTSAAGSTDDPELGQLAQQEVRYAADFPQRLKDYREALARWTQANHEDDPGPSAATVAAFAAVDANTADWKPAPMGSLKITPGIHWYRTTVTVPPEWAGKTITANLGILSGLDTVYYDGVRVGGVEMSAAQAVGNLRAYQIPANLVKAGSAVISIRLVTLTPTDGVMAQSWRSALLCGNAHTGYGPWVTKSEREFSALSAEAIQAFPKTPQGIPNFDTARFLFNGMIHPLIPYALAGVVWYQGESNADLSVWAVAAHADSKWYQGSPPDAAPLYGKIFPTLIKDWRTQWHAGGGQTKLPFYYCQIANYKAKQNQPSESAWAEVREAQRLALDRVPDTGIAVLIDAGMEKDIHPTDKETVGRRLALLALAGTYGRHVESSGPLYQSMTVSGGKARLHFSHLGGGLAARPLPDTYKPRTYETQVLPLIKPRPGSSLQGFEIRGADGKWAWADAVIEGDTVVVSLPEVADPKAVRYAWSDNPTCNLYNAAGLPASPFSTAGFAR